MRRTFLTPALMTLAMMACHKDEQKPPPATTAATQAPAPAAATPDATGGEAKPAADDKPKEEPPKPVEATPLAAAASAAPVDQPALSATSVAELPQPIVAVVGTPSLKALVATFVERAKQVPGLTQTADPIAFVLERVKTSFGLTSTDWLDLDKPLRLAVPDPKKYPDGFVALLPVGGGAKLETSVFASAKPKDGGHWASLEAAPGKTLYLDLEGDVLVLSSHPTLVKDLGGFVKELSGWTPADPLVLDGAVGNARTIFAAELAAAKAQMDGMAKQLEEAGMKAPQLAAMQAMATGIFGVIDGLDRVGVALDPRGDFPRVAISFRPVAGSKLATTIAEAGKRRPALAPLVPAEAWFAAVYDMDAKGLFDPESLMKALASEGKLPLEEADVKAAVGLLGRLNELGTGSSAVTVSTSDSFPFALESISGVTDGAGAREALFGFLGLLFDKAWGKARAQLAQNGVPAEQLPGETFPAFVEGVARLSGPAGIKPSIVSGDGVDALALDLDWSRVGGGRLPSQLSDLLLRLVGPRVELGFSAAANRIAFGFGPHGAARAKESVNKGLDGGVADPWIARAAKDDFAVLSIRPTRLARALVDLPQVAAKRDAIGKLPDDPILVEGASDGTTARVTVTIPLQLVMGLIAL